VITLSNSNKTRRKAWIMFTMIVTNQSTRRMSVHHLTRVVIHEDLNLKKANSVKERVKDQLNLRLKRSCKNKTPRRRD